jgi:hypothetical protein
LLLLFLLLLLCRGKKLESGKVIGSSDPPLEVLGHRGSRKLHPHCSVRVDTPSLVQGIGKSELLL